MEQQFKKLVAEHELLHRTMNKVITNIKSETPRVPKMKDSTSFPVQEAFLHLKWK